MKKSLIIILAFTIPEMSVRVIFSEEFTRKSALYFGDQPSFEEMLKRIQAAINVLLFGELL